MDRVRVDPGMLPLETDILRTGRFAMLGLAKLSEAVLGKDPVSDGFSCLPTVPATLTVQISDGQVYQQANIEATPWSSLAVDGRNIVKQGVSLDATTLTLTPPATVGYAVNVLIQVQYADKDDDPVVRPFYNAANPSQPFTGPGNTSNPTNTTRKGVVSIAPKYGIPNNAGAQSTPLPDAGYIGLFVVTLAYGQTQITSGSIVPYSGAKTVIAKLPAVPSAIQTNAWTAYLDTSATPNLITGAPYPALPAYQNGTRLSVFLGNTNTGPNVVIRMPGLPDRPLVRQNGSPLIQGDIVLQTWITIQDDGTQWRLAGLAQGEVPRFVANPMLFVRTDGNDLNDGSANTPTKAFKTLTAALIFGTSKISYLGSQLVIVMGIPGNYDAPQTAGAINGPQSLLGATGTILITTAAELLGDTTQQANYTVAGSGFVNNTGIVHTSFGTAFVGRGWTLQNNNPVGFGHFSCTSGANAFLERITFAGAGTNAGNQSLVYATGLGQVRLGSGCIVSASMPYGLRANRGGIDLTAKVQMNGNLNYALAFAFAEGSGGGIYAAPGSSVNTTDLAANVSGTRYFAQINASINTIGGGANFFPGNNAGSTATGGQYV